MKRRTFVCTTFAATIERVIERCGYSNLDDSQFFSVEGAWWRLQDLGN